MAMNLDFSMIWSLSVCKYSLTTQKLIVWGYLNVYMRKVGSWLYVDAKGRHFLHCNVSTTLHCALISKNTWMKLSTCKEQVSHQWKWN